MMWRWTIITTEIQTRTEKGTRTKIHSLKMLISACLVNTVTRVSLSHLRLIVFYPCTQEPSMTYVLDFYYSYFFTFTAIIFVTPIFFESLFLHFIMWYHIISFHIISHHIILYHAVLLFSMICRWCSISFVARTPRSMLSPLQSLQHRLIPYSSVRYSRIHF